MSSGWAASAPTAGTRSASPSPSPRCSPASTRRRPPTRPTGPPGGGPPWLLAVVGGVLVLLLVVVLVSCLGGDDDPADAHDRGPTPPAPTPSPAREPSSPGRPTSPRTARVDAPEAAPAHHRPRRQHRGLRGGADGRRGAPDLLAHRRRRHRHHDHLHPAPPDDADLRRTGQRLRQAGAQRRRPVDWYPLNRRITPVLWVFDDGTTVGQDLGEVRRLQRVRIDPVTTRTVQLRIARRHRRPGPGPLGRDYTAISEVVLSGTRA